MAVSKEELDAVIKQIRDEKDAAITAMRAEIYGKVEAELTFLKSQLKDHKDNLTSKRSFQNVPNYPGKPEQYQEWHFKMVTFLGEVEGWRDLLIEIEKLTLEPTVHELKEIQHKMTEKIPKFDMKNYNRELYTVLCMNLTDKALVGIQNLSGDTDKNGFVGWWKLAMECNAMTSQKLQGLNGKIHSPKRVKKYSEVLSAIDEWEKYLKLFELHDGKVSESTKVYCLRQMVPEELEKDIIRLSSNFKTYGEAKAYISEQVIIRRDMKPTGGPVPMEVDNINVMKKQLAWLRGDEGAWPEEPKQEDAEPVAAHDGGRGVQPEDQCGACDEMSAMKDCLSELCSLAKGKGKGGFGGKGKFEGNCSFCGVYGHRMNQCWKKDKEMEALRAKGGGKGDQKGKGSWGSWGGDFGKKGNWGGKNQGGKGNWKGGYGGGKGKGAYGLDQGGWGNAQGYQPNQGMPWMVCNLESKVPEAPPGLGGGFEVLRCSEVEEDEEMNDEDFPAFTVQQKTGKPKMPRMGNYSKNMVRKTKSEEHKKFVKKECEEPATTVKTSGGTWEDFNRALMCLYPKVQSKELNPFIGAKPDEYGWTPLTGVMDSGASESVGPPSMCPSYPITSSPGSRAGQEYVSASEHTITNQGEQLLNVMTQDWREANVKYQIADVTRPLNAVSEICDAGGAGGQYVIFGKHGGWIVNPEQNTQTEFQREGGVYTMTVWVKPREENVGFPRQG